MKRYTVRRIAADLPLDGDISKAPWSKTRGIEISASPWHGRGGNQGTVVKACYSTSSLYLLFLCEDAHISATRTRLNSHVCLDSCVEFFASLPEDPGSYFNLECNCCGTLLMGYGPARRPRRLIGKRLASRIEIRRSVPGRMKRPSRRDKGWTLQIALPLEVLSAFIRRPVRMAAGTRWRANFYRCGGRQLACWSPVRTRRPDFHRPEYFGELTFGR